MLNATSQSDTRKQKNHLSCGVSSSVTACLEQQSVGNNLCCRACLAIWRKIIALSSRWQKLFPAWTKSNHFLCTCGDKQSTACSLPVTLNYRWSSISRQRSVYAIHNIYKRWRRHSYFRQINYPIFHFRQSAVVQCFDRPANATPSLGVMSGKTHFHASHTEGCWGMK